MAGGLVRFGDFEKRRLSEHFLLSSQAALACIRRSCVRAVQADREPPRVMLLGVRRAVPRESSAQKEVSLMYKSRAVDR